MIRWLLNLLGVPPKVAPERRRSLAERLKDPDSRESTIMTRAQAALERHRQREEAIARHRVERRAAKDAAKAERAKHQSEIAESTVLFERKARRATREVKKRRMLKNNPFLASELAKRDAERRSGRNGSS